MDNQSWYQTFCQRIDQLDKGSRVALKRSAGVMLSQADGKAIAAFYRCMLPSVPPTQEDKWFAVACMKCLWDPEEAPGLPAEQVIAQLVREETLSESMQHRVEGLLDTPWDQDGFLLVKLCRFMKLLRQKTTMTVDFSLLLDDLLRWNSDNQSVQRKWARCIFRVD